MPNLSKPNSPDVVVRATLLRLAFILMNVPAEAEARKISMTPVRAKSNMACVVRSLRVVEQSLRVRWGLYPGVTLHSQAVMAIQLTQVLVTATLLGDEDMVQVCTEKIGAIYAMVGGRG